MIDIKIDGLDTLTADLTTAPVKVQARARATVERGCMNIKRDARRFASGIGHAPQYPASITYDISGIIQIEGVIGPDKDRPQGALGNILEYGTSKNAPLTHMGPAFDIEQPRFVHALEGDAEQAAR